jgi:hypothetical protein
MTRAVLCLIAGAALMVAAPAPGGAAPPAARAPAAPAAESATTAPKPAAPAAEPAPAAPAAPAPAKDPGPFSLDDKQGDCLDVRVGSRIVARYVYAYDKSTLESRSETYKPYLHVFTADGRVPITKGVGGLYSHHRGIFIGWQKITFDGKTYNLWEMKGGDQVHQKFLNSSAAADTATFTSLVNWNDNQGETLVEEQRTHTFYKRPAPTLVCVDFISTLKAPRGNITLDGDPEHGGVHYRPHDAIEKTMTRFFFPKQDVDPKAALDLPWAAETYTLSARRYTVIDFNHPDNPSDTMYSAYRDYGRFGAFFRHDIKQGETLTMRYRFWVLAGEMPEITDIDKELGDFWRGAKTKVKLPDAEDADTEPAETTPPAAKPPEKKPPDARPPNAKKP